MSSATDSLEHGLLVAKTAELVSLDSDRTISLDHPLVLVGRGSECDIVVESGKVSRKHCCLAYLSGKVIARDLGSTNGIKFNGKLVEEASLGNGDELIIGDRAFRVRLPSGPPSKPTPPAVTRADTEESDEILVAEVVEDGDEISSTYEPPPEANGSLPPSSKPIAVRSGNDVSAKIGIDRDRPVFVPAVKEPKSSAGEARPRSVTGSNHHNGTPLGAISDDGRAPKAMFDSEAFQLE